MCSGFRAGSYLSDAASGRGQSGGVHEADAYSGGRGSGAWRGLEGRSEGDSCAAHGTNPDGGACPSGKGAFWDCGSFWGGQYRLQGDDCRAGRGSGTF